jgi:hypothetical protein
MGSRYSEVTKDGERRQSVLGFDRVINPLHSDRSFPGIEVLPGPLLFGTLGVHS